MIAQCACGCGERAVQGHHVIKRQTLRRYATAERPYSQLVNDERNIIFVAVRCHERQTVAFKRYTLACLGDEVFEFAAELMGAAAYDRLRREYAGEDPRLDALLELAA